MNPEERVKQLYDQFGQRKEMGTSAPTTKTPHYFLHRTFLGENDLLVILNTKRCAYQCYFCQLPQKSTTEWVDTEDILSQFMYVAEEMKHSLSIFDRVTLSNEGSVLDTDTLSTEALLSIAKCINEMRRVRTIVLETRLEFIDTNVINKIRQLASRAQVNILTGFETYDPLIRDRILFKRETLTQFEEGLDKIADCKVDLTAYVLYKSSQSMTDEEAYAEGNQTIDYLRAQCEKRKINYSIRLNPMYGAKNSRWSKVAQQTTDYSPPKLTDVMKLAESKKNEGIMVYIGLSTEGLDNGSNYSIREDYSPQLVKQVKLFNDQRLFHFQLKG